jgi:hypothetical protein
MDYIQQQIINQDVANKSKAVTQSTDSFNRYLEEARAVYKESFFQIAVVSAGVLSLSVTYVGYVSSLNDAQLSLRWLLLTGWAGLTLAVLGGLLRNYLHTNFGHWQMQLNRVEALRDQDKALLEFATKLPEQIANLRTEAERHKYIKTLNHNLKKYEDAISYNKKKERLSKFVWEWAENAALFGLGLGILCVVIFAAINLPK